MMHRARLICLGMGSCYSLCPLARAEEPRSPEAAESAESVQSEGSSLLEEGQSEPNADTELSTEVARCVSHHEEAQVARLDARLGDAERALASCSLATCPDVIQQDCLTWGREVAAAFPSFVVRARGPNGDMDEGRVFVDGAQVSQALDGKALRVEPGRHVIRLELPSGQSAEESLAFSAGEKTRFVEFDFRPTQANAAAPLPAPSPVLEATRPVSWLTLGFGATALGATALAVGFGVDATVQNNQALDTCAPHCSSETSERVNRSAAISDVSLAVAIVAAVGTAVSYTMRPTVYRPVEAQRLPSERDSPGTGTLAFHSLKKGASLCWQGNF